MATLAPSPPSLSEPRAGVRTVANVITVARTVRTVLAVSLGIVAVSTGDLSLLAVAYGVYWVGDILDGWSARRLGQETRLGAVLDIVSDRASTSVLCGGLIAHTATHLRGVVPVAIVFLLSFMVLDTMLSMAFLCWPLVSPNDFHRVDRRVWLLNWSPVAKSVNTAGVVGALVLGQPWLALALAVAVAGVKGWSARQVLSLLGAR